MGGRRGAAQSNILDTVAILAQGTNQADAAEQAFEPGFEPRRGEKKKKDFFFHAKKKENEDFYFFSLGAQKNEGHKLAKVLLSAGLYLIVASHMPKSTLDSGIFVDAYRQ